MDHYYDVFVKYHDEKEETVVERMLTYSEAIVFVNFLLRERKKHFDGNMKNSHYPDYVRIE